MQIYLAKNGQTLGPFSIDDLLLSVKRGELKPEVFAWFEGATDWMPLRQVPGFENAFAPPPAPTPSATPSITSNLASTGAAQSARTVSASSTAAQAASVIAAASMIDGPNHAGFWKRFVAFIIDYIITYIVVMVIAVVIGVIGGLALGSNQGSGAGLVVLLYGGIFFAWIAYYAFFESSQMQATPGKLAMGLIVTDTDGERISLARGFGRNAGKLLSSILLYLGFVLAAFTKDKQALHDILGSTYVVCKDPNAKPLPTWAIVLLAIIALGFPLIIIGILAAIAVPAYQDYAMRAKMAQVMSEVQPVQSVVTEHLQNHGRLPLRFDRLSPSAPFQDFAHGRLELSDGVLVVHLNRLGHPLDGKTLGLEPVRDDSGNIDWRCGRSNYPNGEGFGRNDARVFTTVDSRYLPTNCR